HVGAAPRDHADPGGIETERGQRLAQCDAVGVLAVERGFVERAGDRAAAEQGRLKAHALLIAEANDFDGKWQALATFVQRANAGDRGQDAEDAVILAGVPDRVEMGAKEQRRKTRLRALRS